MLPTGVSETYAPPRAPAPGQGPPEAHPPAKTLLLKRGKRSPSYIENTIRKEEKKTGDPAAAVDLRSGENIKLDRVRLRDDAPTAAGS